MGRRVLSVEPLGSFALHIGRIFNIFILSKNIIVMFSSQIPSNDEEKLSNWVSGEENHEDARAASQPTNGWRPVRVGSY